MIMDSQQADKELSDKVAQIEVLVAGDYIRKSDFERFSDAVFKKLDRIDEKLDKKEDKK